MRSKIVANLNLEPPALRQIGLRLKAVDGVNLAQGLCIMPMPEVVRAGAECAIAAGHNMYSLAQGIVELREALAERIRSFNKIPVTPDNIVVTAGSTGAFEVVCQTFLKPGDEVISFIPFYPYHRNALLRFEAVTRYVPLKPPTWEIDFAALEEAFTSKTKFLLLTTPNNPTGKVYTRAELERIAVLCKKHDVFVVTDEVYEYITYPGHEHISIASLPDMFERTITLSSYSKTFAITGWRIGFIAAPDSIAEVLKVVFDQAYVCAPTPLQHGVAAGVRQLSSDYYTDLAAQYLKKREILAAGLERAGFTVNKPQGAYYILAGISERFPGKTAGAVVDELVTRARVGAVPATDFIGPEFKNDPTRSNFLRFSYGIPDEQIERAVAELAKF
jgi:aminotransferase